MIQTKKLLCFSLDLMKNSILKGVLMTPIQMTVFSGILMLITALNLKLAIWYIERKQAKKALESYTNPHPNEAIEPRFVSFTLSEIKCVDSVAKNIDTYIDALTSKEIEKIGIMKEDALVAIMIPIEHYEKLLESVLPIQTEVKEEQ